MESSRVSQLYRRSVEKRKLRYIPFIGDGDSSSYNGICIEKPCGETVYIPKMDCIAHVTKRMRTNMRSLVRDYKGYYCIRTTVCFAVYLCIKTQICWQLHVFARSIQVIHIHLSWASVVIMLFEIKTKSTCLKFEMNFIFMKNVQLFNVL